MTTLGISSGVNIQVYNGMSWNVEVYNGMSRYTKKRHHVTGT